MNETHDVYLFMCFVVKADDYSIDCGDLNQAYKVATAFQDVVRVRSIYIIQSDTGEILLTQKTEAREGLRMGSFASLIHSLSS